MELLAITPKQSLNKAFLKQKPHRADIDIFKINLIELIDRSSIDESEEFHKNLLSDFLRKTYYNRTENCINTKGRNDLVIYNGKDSNSSVGAIIETKKRSNKTEMLRRENINVKAFHELILYYLRERISENNLELKYLIATNINEWFIFEACEFEKLFASNKQFVKQFVDFEEGRLSAKNTDFFYSQIAKPYVESISTEIIYTYVDIRDYEKILRNDDKNDDVTLVALYKVFSPEHLLKLPFANDSNTLDRGFYSELLHILGLTEINLAGKKLIQRLPEKQRNYSSIIENTIIQLDSLDKISRLDNPKEYGETYQERLFEVGLELSITWINRILFLKLLEAQLINYHKGNREYAFLNLKKIKNYDDLNTLFFQVLAKKHEDRNSKLKELYLTVPYLNSSLFEPSELEHATIFISNLSDNETIPIFPTTVLKDNIGKKKTREMSTLEYLFDFLDAYDFSSEGAVDIQEDNKTLINASVLGLIFEKINGYKDGSFFTPGLITMYMCRETIRKAIVNKFNETKKWNCNNLTEIFNKDIDFSEANRIVNSIKICDPAVGSGHFLVSALNEIISVKNDLRILTDRDGRRLKHYNIEVENDELVVTDEDGELFEYNPSLKESQRVQEALFHEKQTIIENCLFGVDINPKSVKICRLRLWIELLKHAYYKNKTELETLPNIDINIKCGNSLISRFSFDADLKQALRKSQWSIDMYRVAVQTYRNAKNREEKHDMERLIKSIKSDFRSEIAKNSKEIKELSKLKGELALILNQTSLFEKTEKEKKDFQKKLSIYTQNIQKQEELIEDIKNNKIFQNAFEWRFEFPEVLNDEGDFIGFDIVLGNPPYIRQEEIKDIKVFLKRNYEVFNSVADILTYFVELGYKILRDSGIFQFIISNKFAKANYGRELRSFLQSKTQLTHFIDFSGVSVFDAATVDAAVMGFVKEAPLENNMLTFAKIKKIHFTKDTFANDIVVIQRPFSQQHLELNLWSFADEESRVIKHKIEENGIQLKEWEINIYRGIITGLNEAFMIDNATKEAIVKHDVNSEKFIKKVLRGRNVRKFVTDYLEEWLIYVPKGYTIKSMLNTADKIDVVQEPVPRYGYVEFDEAWDWFIKELPGIAKHLKPYQKEAEKRLDKGDYWWELRACAYLQEFEKPKIIYKDIAQRLTFCYDEQGFFTNNTNYFITGDVNLKYLTAILNSKLIDFYYRQISSQLGENAVRLFTQYVENIPIMKISKEEEFKFVDLIDNIILAKSKSIDISNLERKIDKLVYELYGLTDEEVEVVENHYK